MGIEIGRRLVVSIGEDHRLNIYDLEDKQIVGTLKVKNASLCAICINEDLRRVYVSS